MLLWLTAVAALSESQKINLSLSVTYYTVCDLIFQLPQLNSRFT